MGKVWLHVHDADNSVNVNHEILEVDATDVKALCDAIVAQGQEVEVYASEPEAIQAAFG